MVDEGLPRYRATKKRLVILDPLNSAQESLEIAARAMERDGYPNDAHRTRNVAQSAGARRCLMEQTWEMEDAAKRAARKGKAKK
ncbi:MAG: hypothetical protein LC803_16720 [Acidobacteria bacterium]|nr:hypothetical protein [Acidobacteriota bacterium]